MGIFETAQGWEEGFLSHLSCIDETWYSYTLPKEDPKKLINYMTHPLSSADISIVFL